MTTLQTLLAIWAFVAVCSILFIRGATRSGDTYMQRKCEWEAR